MKLIRVVFYIRVSTEEQKLHGYSLEAQKMKLYEYSEAHGYKVVKIYADEGISGRKEIKKRPQLQQLLKDAENDLFDLILFIKLDRYFRSVAEYHECQKILDKNNVKWTATEEKYDLTTANGRAFVNMKLTIAELEADTTSERIVLTNEYKVKEGYALSGSVPFGWCLSKQNGHSRVIIDKQAEPIVRDALEHLEISQSVFNTINHIYDKYELPFTYKVLRNTLSTSFLYGMYRDNDNYCEAYITKEKYDELQAIINKGIKEYKKNRIYLFSSLVTCGNCGTRMCGHYTNPNKNDKTIEFYNYKCNSRFNRITCKQRCYISEAKLEEYMLDNISKEIENHIYHVEVTDKQKKPKQKQQDKNKIQNEIDRLNMMYQKGRINDKKYDEEYLKLDLKLKEASKAYEEEKPRDLEPLKKLLNSDIRSIYNIMDRLHKRAFWQALIKEIIVYEDKSITFTINDRFK